ncbi:hypothetical protein [Candidatus Methanarcanum hacksteinii]|uniref:hypothetical protein n=1 Tax=Candidatus Methanarcanum hacksteinii TaxID=2911857 RepID=UPI0037DD286C
MSFIKDNPWAIVLSIIGVLVALLLFVVETGIADAFTSIFSWSADNADHYGFYSAGTMIRIIPLIMFGVGIPLGVVAAALRLVRQ